MLPSDRPHSKQRMMSKQRASITPSIYSAEHSPSQLKHTEIVKDESDADSSSSSSQTMSVGSTDDTDLVSKKKSGYQIESTKCVDYKTNKAKIVSKSIQSDSILQVRKMLLHQLDIKEYPLASKQPPESLFNFTSEITHEKNNFANEVVGRKNKITPQRAQQPLTHSTIEKKRWDLSTSIYYPSKKDKETENCSPDKFSGILSLSVDKLISENSREQDPTIPRILCRDKNINITVKSENSNSENDTKTYKTLPRHHRHISSTKLGDHQLFPVTPEVSRLRLSIPEVSESSKLSENLQLSHSETKSNEFCNAQGFKSLLNQDIFLSAVATPPIAESDLEQFVSQGSNSDQYPTYQVTDVWAAQKASLPSPGLSPIHSPNETEYIDNEAIPHRPDLHSCFSCGNHRNRETNEFTSSLGYHPLLSQVPEHVLLDMQSIAEKFDALPSEVKNLMIYQLLRRCSRRNLRVIADIVNPALKCDFLAQLPLELSLQILSFLDHRDLCRSAQVSKHWRNTIDSNETGWKELFDRDRFVLPKGELERAINQGWGWQDPYGPDEYEQDLSVSKEKVCDEFPSSNNSPDSNYLASSISNGRGIAKRKRITCGLERSKRRATTHELIEKSKSINAQYPRTSRINKSEGPLTAANAAILAAPDPKLGLPGLRRLHLFKSLYRRHYMFQHSWMSGKVSPNHFAFPAHAAHVITCLQFDDEKIITGSDDTLINIFDTKTGVFQKKLQGHEGGVWALQYEGNTLVSGSTDRSVRVWDIEKGLCTQVFQGHTSTVRCLLILMPQQVSSPEKGTPSLVPEKPLIITGSRDSQLRVWRLPEQGSRRFVQTGPPANDTDCPYFVRILSGHAHSVRAISAHQDTLVSGSYDNTVRVWRISTGQTVHRLTGHTMKVYSVVLDHKRDRCISGSMDNLVKIWSIETGACLFTLEGHSSLVGLLDLQDERLVSAAADATLRIWDPENGQCKSTLSAHTGAITCFQHDSQKVISGSDRTLKLWNIKTGECIKDLLVDLSGVWQVKFDERRCVAAVQRDNLTYVEVLDFGASRDGVPAYQRGIRRLLCDPSERIVANNNHEDT